MMPNDDSKEHGIPGPEDEVRQRAAGGALGAQRRGEAAPLLGAGARRGSSIGRVLLDESGGGGAVDCVDEGDILGDSSASGESTSSGILHPASPTDATANPREQT